MPILKFMSDRQLKICDSGPSKGRKYSDPDPAKHLDMFMQEHMQVHGHETIQVSNWLWSLNPSEVNIMQQSSISWDDLGQWVQDTTSDLISWTVLHFLSWRDKGVGFVCVLCMEGWLWLKWKAFYTDHQSSFFKTQKDSHRKKRCT